eukprot:CAMPEP_0202916488 /NCGR_PEP_ID=MMETSP1392-20130828/68683_1 /ASSEMBLY_ACC=CAM_ASM_000868 /TAXON_ID=225041 /ORGANISM="Chlamydomonas chlamydogama, Strain SAG 11-48b" /LENGTH=127 /DNA_ID=CAMNT_0049608931 /DNA_START=45 /DNA_END=424 /DNA_ORIENTATION=+
MVSDGPRPTGPSSSLPPLQIVFPDYRAEDIFSLFIKFLDQQGFTYTQLILAKELQLRKIAPTETSGITDADLQHHLTVCMTQLELGSTYAIEVCKAASPASPDHHEGVNEHMSQPDHAAGAADAFAP